MYLKMLLCLILFILIVLIIASIYSNNSESFTDYQKCRDTGHSKEFCVVKPLLPNTCICENGQLGRRLPGLKGACVCQDNQVDKMIKIVNNYTDNLLDKQFGNLPGTFESPFDEERREQSNLKNFFYKRSLLKNSENIIPYKSIGNFAYY